MNALNMNEDNLLNLNSINKPVEVLPFQKFPVLLMYSL